MRRRRRLGARCGDVGDRAEFIRCDDIGARYRDFDARCGDVGDRAELPAISARSYRRYRRGVTGDIGAEFPPISAIAELV